MLSKSACNWLPPIEGQRSGFQFGARLAPSLSLERIFQANLHLAHVGLCTADGAECLMRRNDVQVGHAPVGMVGGVECLDAELEQMLFVEGHPKLFVDFGIEIGDAGPLNGIAADIAKEAGRRFRKSGGVQPAGRCGIAFVRADAGLVWPVVTAIGGGSVVNTADAQGSRNAALESENSTSLPTTYDRIEYGIRDIYPSTLADGQIIQDRRDHAVTDIKRRKSAFAGDAVAVLRK